MEWVGVLGDSYLLTGGCLLPKDVSAPIPRGLESYELAIRLDSAVYEKIKNECEYFYQQYLPQKNFESRSYITIGRFSAKEWMEDTMIRWIQRICSRIKSFNITLNNYSGLPSHSIFLRVMDKEPFRLLARELKTVNEYLRANHCLEICFNRPGLPVAEQLPPTVYEKALADYSQRLFCETFTAREIVLIRNASGPGAFKTVNVFGLLPNENNLFN